jgi:cyclic pyranopterin phosphate synthase
MPADGIEPKPRDELLRYEEIIKIVKLFVELGLYRFRITGGEPLIRKGLIELIGAISQIKGVTDLALTTNGTLLAKYAQALRDAGLKRINISLDSLNPKKFYEITRGGNLQDVLAGIDAVLEFGFSPIKLNTVVIRGTNDDELIDFVHFALDKPLEIRFIEFMPLGERGIWIPEKFVSGREIKESIAREIPLEPINDREIKGGGPAEYYKIKGSPGTIGFITSLTENICQRCNRIRLTADGHLRSCLMADEEYDLKALLRKQTSESEILNFIRQAIRQKPQGRCFSLDQPQISKSPMSTIGG